MTSSTSRGRRTVAVGPPGGNGWLGQVAHLAAASRVGTMSTAPGATKENAPAKSTF